jgi:hypothetical protein
MDEVWDFLLVCALFFLIGAMYAHLLRTRPLAFLFCFFGGAIMTWISIDPTTSIKAYSAMGASTLFCALYFNGNLKFWKAVRKNPDLAWEFFNILIAPEEFRLAAPRLRPQSLT